MRSDPDGYPVGAGLDRGDPETSLSGADPASRHRPPQACAGGIVFDAQGRLLLIRRRNPPSAGTWSIPGGRCRPDESPDQACVREVAEETGLVVAVLRWVGRVTRPGPESVQFDIDDFLCAVTGSDVPVAADDALEARWMTRAEFDAAELAPLLAETLAEWSMLPRH